MKAYKLLLLPLFASCLASFNAFSQDIDLDFDSIVPAKTKPSDLKFLLCGEAFTGFSIMDNKNNKKNDFSFSETEFSPVFLWKLSDKLIYEGEVEFRLNNGSGFAAGEGMKVILEFSNFSYVINDYMMLRAGLFFSSMGIFEDWHHQQVNNKFVSRPLGIGHHGLDSGTDLGLNLRGAFPLRNMKMNYSFDLTNGPKLNFGENDEADAGKLEWENITDNNNNKAIAGRIGLLPFSNSSLEIGGSAQTSLIGDRHSDYENVRTTYFGGDLLYNKDIAAIKGSIVVKSQLSYNYIDRTEYDFVEDSLSKHYSFENEAIAWFTQLSYRPTQAMNKVLRKFEPSVRYSSFDKPEGSKWGKDQTQWAVTLDYWIAWNVVVKLSYEQDMIKNNTTQSRYLVEMAMGF